MESIARTIPWVRVDRFRPVEDEQADASVDAGQDFVGVGADHRDLRP